jgi:hypothetical protein
MPSGPKGRFAPCLPFFWGVWNFSKEAAKSLLVHLSQPAAAARARECAPLDDPRGGRCVERRIPRGELRPSLCSGKKLVRRKLV